MDDIRDILSSIERAQEARREIVSRLPCGSCEIDSEAARACKVYDRPGCKHVVTLDSRREAEKRARTRSANLTRAGIDLSILNADPKLRLILRDQLEPWTAVRAVRRALDSKTLRYLVLGGDHRTGKTLALIYACAAMTDAVYIPAQRLGRINQDTERWIETKLLCVNELGREHLGNGYTASNLEELMAEREYGGKLTIFATNLPLQKKSSADPMPSLLDRYGDLFASRIKPPIGAYIICPAGPAAAEPLPTTNRRHFSEVDEDREPEQTTPLAETGHHLPRVLGAAEVRALRAETASGGIIPPNSREEHISEALTAERQRRTSTGAVAPTERESELQRMLDAAHGDGAAGKRV